ncbi:UNKNOWN [Stylonychia lemnae]|uniref:Uncharacterized protein n=1 Tax=Stylonychia lemnae TaxID=5949 RepID=A0A078AJP2_STYLE|nr:UNKNOWN [Stylonychia lemnae]|eukprot:CDW81028.1 UNKNOWN [Stylonychia lemnae]
MLQKFSQFFEKNNGIIKSSILIISMKILFFDVFIIYKTEIRVCRTYQIYQVTLEIYVFQQVLLQTGESIDYSNEELCIFRNDIQYKPLENQGFSSSATQSSFDSFKISLALFEEMQKFFLDGLHVTKIFLNKKQQDMFDFLPACLSQYQFNWQMAMLRSLHMLLFCLKSCSNLGSDLPRLNSLYSTNLNQQRFQDSFIQYLVKYTCINTVPIARFSKQNFLILE